MKILLVVDMLNDFCHEGGALFFPESREIVSFIKDRIEKYRKSEGDMVIYLNDAHEINDKEFERFPSHALKGTWGGSIIMELLPLDHDKVFDKTRYSGFYHTMLSPFLHVMRMQYGIESVEVVGVCTSICVMDTVGGLANRDHKIIVPRAGVADFSIEAHEFALARMDKLYGAEVI